MAKTSWFSVDGQNVYELGFDAVVDLAVLATGCEVRAQGTSTVLATWTYSGSNQFLGLASSSGSSTPATGRAVGETTELTGMGVTTFYSVTATAAIPVPYLTTDQELEAVADAIRAKGATSALLVYPNGFVSAINAIPTGGSLETGSQTITATESSQSIEMTPSAGYDGFGEVDITVNAIPSNYVGSGVTQRTSSDLTASGATVTAPAGYYASSASKAVASGTAGTPTATKGAVSNHAISVTPSVTNTAGYISGGTKTGTAVSVSASELVSGTYSVTGSGTKDVTNYASISVPSGSASTPATTVTATPSISVSSGGLITASVSTTKSVTPSVSAGYVSSGTAGTVSVSGSNTSQLTTQAAQTITPTTTDQTIASGKYLTGTQTIKGDANLVAENIADGVTIFGVTGTHQGGGTVSLLPAVIRPDAELVKSYTFDKWIVADDGISIPAYTTTATTIYKSAAISDKYTCDFSQYDYFAVLRFLSYPQYGSSVHANHMQEYDIRAAVVDFCEIPSYSLRSFDNTASISTRYVTLFSANQTANVYWTSASALAKATSANAGAYQFISIPKLSGSTVTFYESQRILKGDATVFNQSAWESATDIRFQYVQQLYRSRKGTLNVNGWCSTSNTAVALGAISNNGNLS